MYWLALELVLLIIHAATCTAKSLRSTTRRETININNDWKFFHSFTNPDGVIYDHRPDLVSLTNVEILKPYILPSGNDFISSPSNRHNRPESSPVTDIKYTHVDFDDSSWENVTLPHDWAIKGPFYTGEEGTNPVNGGMGRLPVQGVGWYRRKLSYGAADRERTIYLDVEGAMSYAMVWLNGKLVGGW